MVVAHDLPIKIVLLKNNALAGVMFEQRENSAAAFSPGVAIAALDRLCCLWLRLRLRCFIAVTQSGAAGAARIGTRDRLIACGAARAMGVARGVSAAQRPPVKSCDPVRHRSDCRGAVCGQHLLIAVSLVRQRASSPISRIQFMASCGGVASRRAIAFGALLLVRAGLAVPGLGHAVP